MGSVPAGLTEERRLRHPITLLAMATNRTGLRGVARIDSDQRNASELGLVRQERAQLMKRPGMQIIALRATEPYSVTDAGQVFDGNTASGAFRLFDNLLANPVVLIGCEACLPAGDRRQSAVGATGPIRLETPALATAALANAKHSVTRKDHAVRVTGNVLDTHINAKPAIRFKGVVFSDAANLVQVVVAIAQDKIALALKRVKHLALTLTANERNGLPPVNRPDGNFGLVQFPGQDSIIVSGRSSLAESVLGSLVELVAVGDDRDHAYGRLSGQAKLLTDSIVCSMVYVVSSEGLTHPGLVADVVSCLVPRQKRAPERVGLSLGGLEFYLRDQFHASMIPHFTSEVK